MGERLGERWEERIWTDGAGWRLASTMALVRTGEVARPSLVGRRWTRLRVLRLAGC